MLVARSWRHRRPRQRGVTLVELVVVLGLVGLVMLGVAPSISDWMRGLKLRGAAESIRGGVERARLEALRRNTAMSFWLIEDSSGSLGSGCAVSSTGGAWFISVDDPTGRCGASASRTVAPKAVEGWTPGLNVGTVQVAAFDALGAAVGSVQFNSLGQVQAGGIAVIDVSDSTGAVAAMRILVSTSGSVRLCIPSAAAGDPRQC